MDTGRRIAKLKIPMPVDGEYFVCFDGPTVLVETWQVRARPTLRLDVSSGRSVAVSFTIGVQAPRP